MGINLVVVVRVNFKLRVLASLVLSVVKFCNIDLFIVPDVSNVRIGLTVRKVGYIDTSERTLLKPQRPTQVYQVQFC